MSIEFWPKRHLKPGPKSKPKPTSPPGQWRVAKPTWRKPRLPIGVGKAQQMLSSAIICGNDEEASWVYLATMRNQVTGRPTALRELRKRLDAVMATLPDS